jgi:hypothetical protein
MGFQSSIDSVVSSLPAGPEIGAAHIVDGDTPVYYWNGSLWLEFAPSAGWRVYVIDTNSMLYFNGSAWFEPPAATASGVLVDTTNFTGLLSAADSSVQHALETIDQSEISIVDHSSLTGRQLPDSHSISAITGLQDALDDKFEATVTGSGTLFLADDGVYKAVEGGGSAEYPDQTGNAGKFLMTDGTDVSWEEVTPDITTTEFDAGYKRGGKQVYGIEVDFGALPNTTLKSVAIPDYLSTNVYWIDCVNSFAVDSDVGTTITLPFVHSNAANVVSAVVSGSNISIRTNMDWSYMDTTKIVLLYTKNV